MSGEVYLVVSIIEYEGIYKMVAFSNKEDAEDVVSEIRKYDEIGQYVEGTPLPKLWNELSGDYWDIITKELYSIEDNN